MLLFNMYKNVLNIVLEDRNTEFEDREFYSYAECSI
jgi:hypothetical protein